MVRDGVVRAGLFTFAFALAVPFSGPSSAPDVKPVSVAEAFDAPGAQGVARSRAVRDVVRPEAVAGVESTPAPTPEPTPAPTPTPVPRTPAPRPAALPSLPAPPTGGIVLASWYGPGFYGNRTACGQTYTPQIAGVAHRTLPCGTVLTLEYAGRTVTVTVIDRGPYIAGRTLDLSNATRLALGCPDLCTLSMRIGP